MKKYLYLACAAFIMTACNEECLTERYPSVNSKLPLFEATSENAPSRVELTGSHAIHWKETDRISIFAHTTANTGYQLEEGAGTTNGKFRAISEQSTAGSPLYFNGAVYPYHTENTVKDNGGQSLTFTLNIPQSQTYTKDSFDPVTFPMIAVSSNTSLAFKNVCGVLMLQLTGKNTLAAISLSGNNQEALSGTGTVEMSVQGTPIWTPTSTSRTITLDCSLAGGTPLSDTPTPFYISIPPVEFEKGFTVVLTDTKGYRMTLHTSKTQTIRRNDILKMPTVDCAFTEPPLGTIHQLTITHHLSHFMLPNVGNISVDGKIYWGDDQTDNYQPDMEHTYQTEAPHTLLIEATEAQSVSFKSLKGISQIDFSKF